MARDLSPFTRLTLLISELKGSRLEELTDVRKCDLAHHAGKLRGEFSGTPHQGAAERVEQEAAALLSDIRGGRPERAEEGRQELISSCKRLKDLL
jgi:hypothetical protein